MSKKMVVQREEDSWISKYTDIRPTHERFCAKLRGLLEELLIKDTIKYQVVEARAKTVESFAEKLQRDGKSCKYPLREIADLSGLRVILYYTDDIERACNVLTNEFRIDDSRSVDKRAILAPDQFGYLSVHKVIFLSESRAKLPEWSAFNGLAAEVQVRTVLQHAWAAISHTLQYKREADIPYQFRRKLIRLSGLLELADEEFTALRREHLQLKKQITAQIAERQAIVEIDTLTIREFVARSHTAKAIIKVARDTGFLKEASEPTYSQLVFACERCEIKTIEVLNKQLSSLKPNARTFFTEFVGQLKSTDEYPAHTSPYHLLATIIIGAHRQIFTEALLHSELGWYADYARAVLAAGQVFEDTKQ